MYSQQLAAVLAEARDYLLVRPDVERGALIGKTPGEEHYWLVPFMNVAENPVGLIQMDEHGFVELMDLSMTKRLWGWVHSHPHWLPLPSPTDIREHSSFMHMVIYGVPTDQFGIYSPEEVRDMRRARMGARPAPGQQWKQERIEQTKTSFWKLEHDNSNSGYYLRREQTGFPAQATTDHYRTLGAEPATRLAGDGHGAQAPVDSHYRGGGHR